MTNAIVFLGIQGSGKGTQAKLLAEWTGYQHVNIGDLFREQIASQSEIGQMVKSIIAKGDLVDDDTVFKLISSSLKPSVAGIIFDGFPRNRAQAKFLMANYKLLRVYYLSLGQAEALKRISSRRVCSSCGENYNLISRIPRLEGICDLCGGELKQRGDDSDAAIAQRVKEFYAQTYSLKKLFADSGLLKSIPASKGIIEISEDIKEDIKTL